jgi:cysteinyl-tRNA synthetase
MDDDFNTSVAVAELQSIAGELNRARASGQAEVAATRAAELRALGAQLGLLHVEPEAFLRRSPKKKPGDHQLQVDAAQATVAGQQVDVKVALSDAAIERLIEERVAARQAKNFKESDRIRDELAAAGVLLEDQPGGRTLWRRG